MVSIFLNYDHDYVSIVENYQMFYYMFILHRKYYEWTHILLLTSDVLLEQNILIPKCLHIYKTFPTYTYVRDYISTD